MMKPRLLSFLFAGATAAAGCVTGATLADLPSANVPQGIEVRITTSEVEYIGELIEVRRDALILGSRAQVQKKSGESRQTQEKVLRRVPIAGIRQLKPEGRPVYALPKWSPGASEIDRRYRLVSRFPQGMAPEVFQQVLKAFNQTELVGGHP
jgi:hypothetical protein